MERLNRQFIFSVVMLGLTALPIGAQSQFRSSQNSPDLKMDYSSARREIQNFEDFLDGVISATFNAAPFALSQKTKGAYLQGYGMTFSFVVNIHRAMINTPFGPKRLDDVTPEQKRRRIEDLKDRLMQGVFQKGDILRQLPKEEVVSIVGFFEDRNFPDEENQSKTVILTVYRKDLDELSRREDRWPAFKQRMKIVEY